jgi:CRP/FNR family cyclic AMP-dependent transcriptional regulator
VFYLQTGKVRLTVVSKTGKEATIPCDGSFFGEGSLAGQPLRMGAATAMTDCALLRIEKRAMLETLHQEHTLSDLFVEQNTRKQPGIKLVAQSELAEIEGRGGKINAT